MVRMRFRVWWLLLFLGDAAATVTEDCGLMQAYGENLFFFNDYAGLGVQPGEKFTVTTYHGTGDLQYNTRFFEGRTLVATRRVGMWVMAELANAVTPEITHCVVEAEQTCARMGFALSEGVDIGLSGTTLVTAGDEVNCCITCLILDESCVGVVVAENGMCYLRNGHEALHVRGGGVRVWKRSVDAPPPSTSSPPPALAPPGECAALQQQTGNGLGLEGEVLETFYYTSSVDECCARCGATGPPAPPLATRPSPPPSPPWHEGGAHPPAAPLYTESLKEDLACCDSLEYTAFMNLWRRSFTKHRYTPSLVTGFMGEHGFAQQCCDSGEGEWGECTGEKTDIEECQMVRACATQGCQAMDRPPSRRRLAESCADMEFTAEEDSFLAGSTDTKWSSVHTPHTTDSDCCAVCQATSNCAGVSIWMHKCYLTMPGFKSVAFAGSKSYSRSMPPPSPPPGAQVSINAGVLQYFGSAPVLAVAGTSSPPPPGAGLAWDTYYVFLTLGGRFGPSDIGAVLYDGALTSDSLVSEMWADAWAPFGEDSCPKYCVETEGAGWSHAVIHKDTGVIDDIECYCFAQSPFGNSVIFYERYTDNYEMVHYQISDVPPSPPPPPKPPPPPAEKQCRGFVVNSGACYLHTSNVITTGVGTEVYTFASPPPSKPMAPPLQAVSCPPLEDGVFAIHEQIRVDRNPAFVADCASWCATIAETDCDVVSVIVTTDAKAFCGYETGIGCALLVGPNVIADPTTPTAGVYYASECTVDNRVPIACSPPPPPHEPGHLDPPSSPEGKNVSVR